MTASATHRARLDQIRERAQHARGARNRARQVAEAARSAGDSDAAAIAEASLEVAQTEVETSEALVNMMLSQISGLESNPFDRGFFDDPEALRSLELMAHTSQPIGNVVLGRFASAEQFAASLGRGARRAESTGGSGSDVGVPASARMQAPFGIVRQLYQPLDLLDLIPTAAMTGAAFTYIVEGGDMSTGADVVEEGEIKPMGSIDLDEGEVRAVTIASWIKARRQVLDDVAGLQTVITERLTQLVRQKIQSQLLAGDGAGEHLLGILNRDGVAHVDGAGMPAADAVLRGLTTVRMNNAAPTGVVLNPLTYEGMLTERDAGGGRLDSAGAFAGTPVDAAWGIPVVQTAAVDPDVAVVADWAQSAVLFVREGLTVRISDADQDDFVRNRITVLCETRVGLMVAVPPGIAVVHLGGGAAPEAAGQARPRSPQTRPRGGQSG